MGKDITFFLFIGMFSGLVAEAKAFRKEEDAEMAFHEYTGYNWEAVTSDDQVMEMLDATKYTGSCIQELQIEP